MGWQGIEACYLGIRRSVPGPHDKEGCLAKGAYWKHKCEHIVHITINLTPKHKLKIYYWYIFKTCFLLILWILFHSFKRIHLQCITHDCIVFTQRPKFRYLFVSDGMLLLYFCRLFLWLDICTYKWFFPFGLMLGNRNVSISYMLIVI